MFQWRKEKTSEPAIAQSTPDAELVRGARAGDKRAFVEIVARHQAMLCGVALGILGDFTASEDAAQEAFLAAWKKIRDLREPERLRPWLAQIARNTALGHLRQRRGHNELDDALTIADGSPAPDELAASDEEAALVRESLAKMPESYRLPLILFYREGQSVHAVAETLGISEDAVKQRLARGREMLRERMSGLVETVLTRTRPTAVFTMMVAAAIGALAAPAAIASTVFAASATAGGAAATGSSTPLLTAMNTTKTSLIAAAVVTAACVPVGYQWATNSSPIFTVTNTIERAETRATGTLTNRTFDFSDSALFAEWRQLHELHGNTPEAMPAIYKAIADMKDSFRRRAFRSALIAEWVQLDPASGLKFFLAQKNDTSQRRQFFEEWLSRDATNAVAALMMGGEGWQSLARDSLTEIARRVPSKIPDIVSQLPKAENNYWDTKVRDAFAIVAEQNLSAARTAAESITGPNRDQALAGIAQAWAKSDLASAIAWAKKLPDGADRDEIIRAALFGRAAVEPAAALELVSTVPPGGRSGYFATTTGARVLSEAAKTDFDATVAWITANPSRFGHEDMMGLAQAVTERLNADPAAFLTRASADGSLKAILPAIGSALLNDAAGQRENIWEWLKTQPKNDATETLRREVLSSTGYQDPTLALKLSADIPRDAEGDQQMRSLAMSLWNGGRALTRFDSLIAQAPERMRGMLLETAFQMLGGDALSDPQTWISRLSLLPDNSRPQATEQLARAWARQAPETAIGWVSTLPANDVRSSAAAAIAGSWAASDASSVATWVAAMQPGPERDRSAQSLATSIAARYPNQAWDWAMSIGDGALRATAAQNVVQQIAIKDRTAAQQFIESAQVPADMKPQLQAAIQNMGGAVRR
jgi:RNA polymerase sigma factor (sigma-70 family)